MVTPFESQRPITLRDGRAILLRPVHPDDAADLVEIRRQVVAEDISHIGMDVGTVEERADKIRSYPPEKLYLVAEAEGGRVVGSLDLSPFQGASYLQHLRQLGIELHSDWRGSGLGSAMIRYAADWGRAHGVEIILLGVLDSNPRAKALYQQLGFVETGYVPRFVKRPDGSYVGDTQMALAL